MKTQGKAIAWPTEEEVARRLVVSDHRVRYPSGRKGQGLAAATVPEQIRSQFFEYSKRMNNLRSRRCGRVTAHEIGHAWKILRPFRISRCGPLKRGSLESLWS